MCPPLMSLVVKNALADTSTPFFLNQKYAVFALLLLDKIVKWAEKL
jgi:hypothetical protein